MIRFVIISALIACIYCASAKDEGTLTSSNRIIGGTPANILNFPHQLSLIFGLFHVCGASIIGVQWGITSATCVVGLTSSNFRVRAGSSVINSGGYLRQVIRVIPHELFSPSTLDYDIAVFQVDSNFNVGQPGVNTIPLALAGSTPGPGLLPVITGWGAAVEGGSLVTDLQSATVATINLVTCRESYGNLVTERMICAGSGTGGVGHCHGDQGGPLVLANTLVGISSWSYGCGRPNLPAVFTSIGALRTWITANSGI